MGNQSINTEKSPKIFIHDDLHPEDNAMLQALYSRSPDSVVNHLEKVKSAGSGNFMSKFYVGYGHSSIGDCGSTTIYVENYSMLAAKTIQDNSLYSGQEASTRYLDYSEQPMYDPYKSAYTTAILDKWMELYNAYMPKVQAALKEQYPFDSSEYKSETVWENGINARAFDTLRSYLPVGTTTLLSWTTNLRQARDNLMRMKNNVLPEIRQLADDLFVALAKKYPNSFDGDEMDSDTKKWGPQDSYMQSMAAEDSFQSYNEIKERFELSPEEIAGLEDGELLAFADNVDVDGLNRMEEDALTTRPKWAPLPKRLSSYGSYNFIFTIDFGSFRDLQRHRNGVCRLPLIDGQLGMFPWYMEELKSLLSEADYSDLVNATNEQFEKINNLAKNGIKAEPELTQYLLPMGVSIVCNVTYSVPQTVYVAELRSSKTVHSSLRPIAQNMALLLEDQFPGITIYADMDEDNWTVKRGTQTITAKSA